MISKKEVLANNPEYRTLINAVVRSIGLDSVNDVNKNGINCGFGGFIYYEDTHAFAMRYRKLIIKMLENMADDLGEDVVNMVCNFNCVNGDSEDKKELYKYLGGGRNEQSGITNAVAWFAAEEVCRMFDN